MVDDDPFQLDLLYHILKRTNIPSVRTTGGAMALTKIEQRIRSVQQRDAPNLRLFKLVFTDFSMPGMNGPELMSRITMLY